VHNIDRLRYHAAVHNWSDHLRCSDVQSVYDLFLRDVSMRILCNIPTKFVTVSPRDPSYVTPLVKSLLNKRRRLRKRGRLDEANILSGKITLLIQQARSKELSKLSQATPKELWASVKNTTTNCGTSCTFPPHLFADIEFVNRYFSDICIDPSYNSANVMQYIQEAQLSPRDRAMRRVN